MPKSYLEPAGDHVLIADMPRETEISGISLPDSTKQQEMCFGVVVHVGPDVLRTKAEDIACYGPYAGKLTVMNGTELRLMHEGQIEAYVRTVQDCPIYEP